MRVPLQHLRGLVSCYSLHGHDGQAPLTKPAGGLMAQIMKGHPLDASFLEGLEVAGPHSLCGVGPNFSLCGALPTFSLLLQTVFRNNG